MTSTHRRTKGLVAKDNDEEVDEVAEEHQCVDISGCVKLGVGHLVVEVLHGSPATVTEPAAGQRETVL